MPARPRPRPRRSPAPPTAGDVLIHTLAGPTSTARVRPRTNGHAYGDRPQGDVIAEQDARLRHDPAVLAMALEDALPEETEAIIAYDEPVMAIVLERREARLAAEARAEDNAIMGRSKEHSADGPTPSGGKVLLPFQTARQLAAALPEHPVWILRDYIAAGALHELVGRAKAGGKTTFAAHLVAAILDGRDFLGRPTLRTPVVLLTEQPGSSLRAVLGRAGLAERDDLLVLTWRAARGATWADVVAAALAECQRIGARLLVVDTLGAFAGIRGEAENDAGAALEAIAPLQAAAADGLAVLVVRHERKGGGEVGDSGRGSSAFTGAVDVVLRLTREPNAARPTLRTLAALSRFDATPEELIVELTDAGYLALGDALAVALIEARQAVVDTLAAGEQLTTAELIESVGGARTTVQAAIAELVDSGEVGRAGAGKKGDPYRYQATAAVSAGADADRAQGFYSAADPLRGSRGRQKETDPAGESSGLWSEAAP